MLNTEKIKSDFPILSRTVHGKPLVYLDNAATSQKPQVVIDSLVDFYTKRNANIKRGAHTLGDEATDLYEAARVKVQRFLNARYPEEIIFTKGTTDSINLIATSWGRKNLQIGDGVAFLELEHHSNLIPWQQLVKDKNGFVCPLMLDDNGFLNPPLKKQLIENPKASQIKLLALAHASNVFGSIQNLKEITKEAHKLEMLVLADGAQAAPHMKVDVQSLGIDFYAFSAHKMLGPTGVGVLYVKKEILDTLEPYQFGGGMIKEVEYEDCTFAELPNRFEAGTPNIEGVIGFGAAIDYLNAVGIENIRNHEIELLDYAHEKLSEVEGLKIIGTLDSKQKTGVVSFTVAGIHPHDLSSVLDTEGVAIRSGHHCTQPLHRKLNMLATSRASFYLYNTTSDIDALILGIEKAKRILL